VGNFFKEFTSMYYSTAIVIISSSTIASHQVIANVSALSVKDSSEDCDSSIGKYDIIPFARGDTIFICHGKIPKIPCSVGNITFSTLPE
jgi:hypothetical protein